jgi:hypothetical protein
MPTKTASVQWPIPSLVKQKPEGYAEQRQFMHDLAVDRVRATVGQCQVCRAFGGQFDWHYQRTPFSYKCYVMCPNGHLSEY